MIDIQALLTVIPVFILALMSPGPDFMVVSSTALARGRNEGIKTAAGIATVIAGYTLLSLMGVSALFSRYLWLVVLIKACGGAYLAFIGYQLLRSSLKKTVTADLDAAVPPARRSAYMSGVLVCLTNPKAIAFFASIFAIALKTDTSTATQAIIALAVPGLTFTWFSLV